METEYYAHQYAERPPGESEVVDEDFDAEAIQEAMANGADWEDL